MTQQLPVGGVLKMSDIKKNLEITSSADLSLGDPLLRALAGVKTGSIKMSDFYSSNELESLILAGDDDNGQATGYYQSFWGENDRPQFGTQNLVGAYDAFDSDPDKFVFAVSGNQPRTTFRAVVMNNVIFYEEDATTYEYLPGSDTTVWTWVGTVASLVAGTVYELSYLIGPDNEAAPPPEAGTYPVGQGTDWVLTFEDDFDGPTMDYTKWNRAQWYLLSDETENPTGVDNFDISASRLRIWPLQYEGRWIRRDFTTHGKFAQVDGYWEMKCKAPAGNSGFRISFWTLNHDTTARPIVAIMQALAGQDPESGWSNIAGDCVDYAFGVQPTTDGQWHEYWRYNDLLPTPPVINLSTGDHVFGIKKTSSMIHFYLDGEEMFSTELLGPNTMTLPQYMIMTLDYNSSTPDASTIQNSTAAFEIDYVRAWIPAAGTGGSEEPTLPSGYVAPVGRPSSAYPYLTFREEFDGTTYDTTKWNNHLWYLADNGKANIKVENSTLYMWPALPFASGTTDYNATLDTDGKFYQKYGYFECRAKLPIGRGCWPAFWLYNHDLTGLRPEIDIFEAYSGGNTSGNDWADASLHPIRYAATVWGKDSMMHGSFNSATVFGYVDLSETWHVYGVHWERNQITFYFDGNAVGTLAYSEASNHLDMRMYILIDLWLGSISGQANTDETPTGQTNSLMVDYIRAWALADGSTVVEGTVPELTEAEGGKGTGTSTPVAPKIVAFVGNSTTWGYKTSVGGQVDIPYPMAFSQRQTSYDVRNHGINSTQTEHWINGTNGVTQTFSAFMAANPDFDYVCLDFGTLDQFDMTTTEFKDNLKTMIAEIRLVSGRTPILITPFIADFSGLAAYAQAVRDAGAETQTAVIDKYTWSVGVVENNGNVVRDYVPDGVHPSDQFYIDGGAYVANQWATAIGAVTPPEVDPSNPMPTVPVGHAHTYTLVFNEEFNGSNLNFDIWNDHIWWNEGGEKTGKPVNWQVSDGQLHIFPADGFYPRTIDTDGKYYQTLGFFECESKLPVGRGPWPAFWLYNHDEADWRPEIDIMEAYPGGGFDSWWSDAELNPINYGMTLWQRDGSKIDDTTLRSHIPDGVRLDTGYHKYGALWETDGVTFFFDGQQMGDKMPTSFFTRRMYILLDLYFGSASGTPSDAETTKGMGNAFSTRYVRAWKKN